MARDMAVFIRWGDIQVGLQAEGVAWNPDVADDMVKRAGQLWDSALAEAQQYGFFDEMPFVEDDEDEELEVDEEAANDFRRFLNDLTEGTDG